MLKAVAIKDIYHNKWDEVIEDAKKKYRIDSTRVYITGICAGGGGTMMYAKELDNNYAEAEKDGYVQYRFEGANWIGFLREKNGPLKRAFFSCC